jgi:hypothetical protein
VRDRDAEPHPAFQLALVSKRPASSLARAGDDVADRGQGVSDVRRLWVPKTSSTSCDQAVFVDRAADARLSLNAVLTEVGRLG